MGDMKRGDFTGLAEDYARYRPGYSKAVLDQIAARLARPIQDCDAVDVGAGTGIWTKMLVDVGFNTVTAVEPSDDMRSQGEIYTPNANWKKGSGDNTGLNDASADIVSMASSFHWPAATPEGFAATTKEFHRILRQNGIFVALWNPRKIEANPLIGEIEAHIKVLYPALTRVSSGNSGITATLTEQLKATNLFADVEYIEDTHTVHQTAEHYIGVWRSVNDVQSQLGPALFDEFLTYAAQKINENGGSIETTYLTRAWVARGS